MKNFSVLFNMVLLVLVGILFWLYMSLKKSADNSGDTKIAGFSNASGKERLLRIAHVNIDTLNVRYQCMLDFKKEMESRQNTIQNEYDSKGKIFQEEYQEYQQKAQAGNISQVDAEKAQKDLQIKKAELDNLQRNHDDLMKEAQDRETKILELVQKYISGYNKKIHCDYILAYVKAGTNILYANDSLDITKEVISGLNKDYADSLSKAASKPH